MLAAQWVGPDGRQDAAVILGVHLSVAHLQGQPGAHLVLREGQVTRGTLGGSGTGRGWRGGARREVPGPLRVPEGLAAAAPGLRCAKVGELSSVTLTTTWEAHVRATQGRALTSGPSCPFCF